MPRTPRPERYPPEFYQLIRTVWKEAARIVIPCESAGEAAGLRTKLYYFLRAVELGAEKGGPQALASRLISARRIAALPHEEGDAGWAVEYAKDLLAAAADTEIWVEGTDCILMPKSQNRFALKVRAALDARSGVDLNASLERLKKSLKEEGE